MKCAASRAICLVATKYLQCVLYPMIKVSKCHDVNVIQADSLKRVRILFDIR